MRKIIGIVGGVGPYAGLDLQKKVFDNTKACSDQEHLEAYLISRSSHIQDRTEYLLNPSLPNPAIEIFKTISVAYALGAEVIGIPCNTTHSPAIYDVIASLIKKNNVKVKLLHMIEEAFLFVGRHHKKIRKIGLLCTKGTYCSGIYQRIFQKRGYEILVPDEEGKKQVHDSIYRKEYGIKSFSDPVTDRAKNILTEVANLLTILGAEAIIMGCTEIPLAMRQSDFQVPLIDPTDILARALIREVDSHKLIPIKK